MGEDIRENEMTELQSVDWIRGLLGSDSGKISIRNLIDILPFMLTNDAPVDLNAITKTGVYIIANEHSNVPPDSGQIMGSSIFHLEWDNNSAKQLYFPYYSYSIFYRFKVGGNWHGWKVITFS